MNAQSTKQNNGQLLPSEQRLHFHSLMKCIAVLSARKLTLWKCRLCLQVRREIPRQLSSVKFCDDVDPFHRCPSIPQFWSKAFSWMPFYLKKKKMTRTWVWKYSWNAEGVLIKAAYCPDSVHEILHSFIAPFVCYMCEILHDQHDSKIHNRQSGDSRSVDHY